MPSRIHQPLLPHRISSVQKCSCRIHHRSMTCRTPFPTHCRSCRHGLSRPATAPGSAPSRYRYKAGIRCPCLLRAPSRGYSQKALPLSTGPWYTFLLSSRYCRPPGWPVSPCIGAGMNASVSLHAVKERAKRKAPRTDMKCLKSIYCSFFNRLAMLTLSSMMALSWSMLTRSCSMLSRNRSVTVLSLSVS